MKSIIILLLMIGVITVVYGYMKSFYKPSPPKTEVRYITRSVFNEQFDEDISKKFQPMFDEPTAGII
jgi:hypothetical protein